MCDTVFTLQPLLYRHFDQHIENQKVSVFKCPDCSLLYAQKQLMMDHIKVRGPSYFVWMQDCSMQQIMGRLPISGKQPKPDCSKC